MSYDQLLADWKKRHGVYPHGNTNPDEFRMAAEEAKSSKSDWCFECSKYLRVPNMKLITRRIDPYLQCDEGPTDYIAEDNRVRMCWDCYKAKYAEDDPT